MFYFPLKRSYGTFSFLISNPVAIGFIFLILHTSCSVQKQITKSAKKTVLGNTSLQTAHIGISIFEPGASKYWYNYQGDKYFVPASNTKIPTCYAAMKYLGDSLTGLRYTLWNSDIIIQGTGDPSFLHPDFKNQPVFDFLNSQTKEIFFAPLSGAGKGWGNGWSWNDYNNNYMAERSAMPIYGNLVRFKKTNPFKTDADSIPPFSIEITPRFFADKKLTGNVNWKNATGFSVERTFAENYFIITPYGNASYAELPFTNIPTHIIPLLSDTLHKRILSLGSFKNKPEQYIRSQPTDSLLKPMMHRSDNFFAEQSLLMVGNEILGIMNDASVIDTILKTDFKDLPQKPRWADGSGLSRYNLFTPQDFVAILNKMKNEFGMERIKLIFPTGGTGTLSNYYKPESGYIYAKTGTLSGVVSLSGFLYTKKNKLLIFSVLVNNHQASATDIRRAVEKFLQGIRNKY